MKHTAILSWQPKDRRKRIYIRMRKEKVLEIVAIYKRIEIGKIKEEVAQG